MVEACRTVKWYSSKPCQTSTVHNPSQSNREQPGNTCQTSTVHDPFQLIQESPLKFWLSTTLPDWFSQIGSNQEISIELQLCASRSIQESPVELLEHKSVELVDSYGAQINQYPMKFPCTFFSRGKFPVFVFTSLVLHKIIISYFTLALFFNRVSNA